ncbi:MAG: aldose 1-epimerase family protein [Lachnospiraceae bacterium]
MNYELKNEKLSLAVSLHGAELKSLKDAKGTEYLWCADPEFWGRTAPVLFPIVGSLKDKKFTHQGTEYPMGQHGFARDTDFELESQSENSLTFVMRSNEETLKKYPFSFELRISYTLTENTVKVAWDVKNTGDETMYFSIGAHPAFMCPLHGEESKAGYGLDFGTGKEVVYRRINSDGLALNETETLATPDGTVIFTEDFYDDGVYIVEGQNVKKVSLLDPQKNPYITVAFDAPLYGTWSPEKKNAPFVCIEPWYGRCDKEDFLGTLEEREYGNVLESQKTFSVSYTITADQA